MRSLLILVVLGAIFAGGCSMAGPGVARVQAPPGPNAPVAPIALSGDPSWANPRTEPEVVQSAAGETGFGTDFSKRELGVRYFDKDQKIEPGSKGPRYANGSEKRQAERREARRKAAEEKQSLANGPAAAEPKTK
ncbi:MAG: hypothetical protein IT462_05095 [Planctomycetes bacterium]|nr:hypothetical protein [Planctomycetota bacterium]